MRNLKKKFERLKRKNRCIRRIMNKTGWGYVKTYKQLKFSSEKYNISNKEYEKYELFKVPADIQGEKYAEILALEEQEKQKKYDNKIKKIAVAAGWEFEKAKEKFEDAHQRTGCTSKEFIMYKFYELDDEVQNEMFLMDMSKNISEKYNVSKHLVNVLCNKEATNAMFSEYLKRPWCVNTKISFVEFEKLFSNAKKIIYKPLSGHRGQGVVAYELLSDNKKEIYEELITLPDGVVEEYVKQHPDMSALSSESVNTIRIVTLSSDTQNESKDERKIDVAYAAVRIGGGKSIVDNFHSGGMVAAIDLKTGELVTDAVDMEGNVFEKHPVSGKRIKTSVIPYFTEAVEMVKDAIEKKDVKGYLGWDIAISEEGPVLIEINTMPGVVLLSMPYLPEKKGMKHVMEVYL